MYRSLKRGARRVAMAVAAAVILSGGISSSQASDHLDTPSVVANPQADIADVYAWTSPDHRQLNLVMTIVGHTFSNKLQYVFHVDSGKAFGHTTATTSIVCRVPAANAVDCHAGNADSAVGDASNPSGLQGQNHRFRVYAGLRDDPFFNNVKGSLAAYQTEFGALKNGAVVDAAGCPNFDQATSQAILDQFRHTDGGPATNFLTDWTVSAIVISVDLGIVSKGGKLLAVWGTTSSTDKQLDRMARPFMGNTLLGSAPFSTDDASGSLREQYNAATPSTAAQFIPEIQKSLALHDGLDGRCGNQILADQRATPSMRYRPLATLLADDRLWVNSASSVCTQFFTVELADRAGQKAWSNDCGGRTPNYGVPNVWRSLLVDGTTDSVTDGLSRDEHEPSSTAFPFLAAPDPHGIDH